MSNGSLEPESPKDVQCKHCGLYFRNDGIGPHEENCDRKGKEPFQPLIGADAEMGAPPSDEGDDPSGKGTDPTPDRDGTDPVEGVDPPGDSGDDDGRDQNDVDSGEPGPRESITDGGPQSPPTPETSTSSTTSSNGAEDSDPPKPDQLPDRYVDVDDYLTACREKGVDEDDVAQLATLLEGYDVVDVQATTSTKLVAHQMEEFDL